MPTRGVELGDYRAGDDHNIHDTGKKRKAVRKKIPIVTPELHRHLESLDILEPEGHIIQNAR